MHRVPWSEPFFILLLTRTLRPAVFASSSDLAPVTTCKAAELHSEKHRDTAAPSTGPAARTILPEANMRAVVFGSLMRMMAAANR